MYFLSLRDCVLACVDRMNRLGSNMAHSPKSLKAPRLTETPILRFGVLGFGDGVKDLS